MEYKKHFKFHYHKDARQQTPDQLRYRLIEKAIILNDTVKEDRIHVSMM